MASEHELQEARAETTRWIENAKRYAQNADDQRFRADELEQQLAQAQHALEVGSQDLISARHQLGKLALENAQARALLERIQVEFDGVWTLTPDTLRDLRAFLAEHPA